MRIGNKTSINCEQESYGKIEKDKLLSFLNMCGDLSITIDYEGQYLWLV